MAAGKEITATERVLALLTDNPHSSYSSADLAEIIGISRQSVSNTIAPLMSVSLIEHCPYDKTKYRLSFTPRKNQLAQRVFKPWPPGRRTFTERAFFPK